MSCERTSASWETLGCYPPQPAAANVNAKAAKATNPVTYTANAIANAALTAAKAADAANAAVCAANADVHEDQDCRCWLTTWECEENVSFGENPLKNINKKF